MDPINQNSSIRDKCFQSWLTYYNSRNDKHAAQWTISIIDHPIQEDHFNCGVFVINFIKCYLNHKVFNNKIQFETSPASLECDRHLI